MHTSYLTCGIKVFFSRASHCGNKLFLLWEKFHYIEGTFGKRCFISWSNQISYLAGTTCSYCWNKYFVLCLTCENTCFSSWPYKAVYVEKCLTWGDKCFKHLSSLWERVFNQVIGECISITGKDLKVTWSLANLFPQYKHLCTPRIYKIF